MMIKWAKRMIPLFELLLVLCFSACSESKTYDPKSEKAYLDWWTDEHYKESWHYCLKDLKELTNLELQPPKNIKNDFDSIFEIYGEKEYRILFVNPRDKITDLDDRVSIDEYMKKLKECSNDHSWIVLLPENKWIPTKVTYCQESYGVDEVGIVLYWCSDSVRPIIELVTNGPACVPSYLFAWDRNKKTYLPMGYTCGG